MSLKVKERGGGVYYWLIAVDSWLNVSKQRDLKRRIFWEFQRILKEISRKKKKKKSLGGLSGKIIRKNNVVYLEF